jgi:hypothetical protein
MYLDYPPHGVITRRALKWAQNTMFLGPTLLCAVQTWLVLDKKNLFFLLFKSCVTQNFIKIETNWNTND